MTGLSGYELTLWWPWQLFGRWSSRTSRPRALLRSQCATKAESVCPFRCSRSFRVERAIETQSRLFHQTATAAAEARIIFWLDTICINVQSTQTRQLALIARHTWHAKFSRTVGQRRLACGAHHVYEATPRHIRHNSWGSYAP
jgi:hypothetical protein